VGAVTAVVSRLTCSFRARTSFTSGLSLEAEAFLFVEDVSFFDVGVDFDMEEEDEEEDNEEGGDE